MMRKPTAEECNDNITVHSRDSIDGYRARGYACWFPHIGGCVVPAVVVFGGAEEMCCDLLLWIRKDQAINMNHNEDEPIVLHLCDVQQLKHFAQSISAIRTEHNRIMLKEERDKPHAHSTDPT